MKHHFFKDIKVHLLCILLVVVAEFIGIIPFKFGPISFSLLPMLFALVLGVVVAKLPFLKVKDEEMDMAASYVSISVMYLIGFMACSIGPNLDKIVSAGPAFILQEFGNLGTIIISLPIALYVFKMDRTAIGSTFSNSRETSLGIVGNLYGLDGPEGRGVMGSYITGTLLGTIFCGIMASLLVNIPWFSPESLAMASGMGSASMMSASIAPIVEAFPEKADILNSFSATSQVLTSATGIYMSLFIGIPMTEWLYKLIKGKKVAEAEKQALESERHRVAQAEGDVQEAQVGFAVLAKILIISAIFAMVAIWINSVRSGKPAITFSESLPGMIWLTGIIAVAVVVDRLMKKVNINLPTILYIALFSSIMSIPGFLPGAAHYNNAMTSISLLPLCTPILAYAGISTAKELAAFKQQGIKIIIVTLLTFVGTFIGSAIIANIVLKLTGVI